MRVKLAVLISVAFLLVLGTAAESFANISQAAALFLRISSSARAAGMGDAFVAVADDATAVHWNPAGLGAYPLADTWIEMGIRSDLRPLKGVAVLKTRGGGNYQAYDVWAITSKGLYRFDNKRWHEGELFETRTDQTAEKIVSQYFNVTDQDKLNVMIDKVARANNKGSYESLVELRDKVLAAAPSDYSGMAALQSAIDSMLTAYRQCRLNWDEVSQAQELFASGMKDSSLSEREIDRISFACEHAKTRFIPEELTLPYATTFTGELTAISSTGEMLLVGTTDGLVKYTGKTWQTLAIDAGLPSNNITCLQTVGNSTLVGTDQGPARFNGLTVEPFDSTANAPVGIVSAIGGRSNADIYAVVGNDLFHFDGKAWSNWQKYAAVLDDTPDTIADRFGIYRTPEERTAYLAKFAAMNPAKPSGPDSAAPASVTSFTAGDTLKAPYVAELKSKVNAIYVGLDKSLWLGTEHGVFYFEQNRWVTPGYRTDTLKQDQSLSALIENRQARDSVTANAYVAALYVFNSGLTDTVKAGTAVTLYRNPTSAPVNNIGSYGSRLYFAGSDGLLEYDGQEWGRADVRGLGHGSSTATLTHKNELWFVGSEKMVLKGGGRPEISTMYVKWLPTLSDDLYYTNAVFTINTQNWGTFGGDITFISYGKFVRTGSTSPEPIGEFESFDFAVTGAYGTSLTNRLKAGLGVKLIYSKLSDQGAGAEQGKGSATGFGVDLGLLWHTTNRMNVGVAVTNIGPKISYIDAAQADDLPRNLAVGVSYKLIQSEYNRLIVTTEVNKMLVGLDGKIQREIKELVINSGAEFTYANLIAARAGYIYDDEGKIKVWTVGAGLHLFDRFRFDFAYIPSQKDAALNNILRLSFSVMP
ncbi:MAG: PorV/PorQ family protein [Candidatus Zixiibacteriota bacterium]